MAKKITREISKQEAENAQRVLSAYAKQKLKKKSKEVYAKGKAATEKGAKSLGSYIKKVLTTK